MRFCLLVCMCCLSLEVLSQLYPCDGQQKEEHYKLDRSATLKGYDLAGNNQTWIFSELKSPYARMMSLKPTATHKYSYLFPSSKNYWSDGIQDYFLDEKGEIIGEILPLEGRNQPLYREYIKGLLACLGNRLQQKMTTSVVELPNETGEAFIKRLFVKSDITSSIGARGKLFLPEGSFDVERWDIKRDFNIELQEYSRAGWIPSQDKYNYREVLNYFTDKHEYWFVEKSTQRLLAKLWLSGNNLHVLYKTDESSAIHTTSKAGQRQFFLYPTTGFGDIKLDFLNFSNGEYQFEVVSAIGQLIWSKKFMINRDGTHNIDLSFLPKGPYIYSLYDKNRNVIVTKRFAIIKP